MQKLKFASFSAAAGFLLSLMFGIFSHSTFIKVFLTALICAVVFGLLGFGISFIYGKFLKMDDLDSSVSSGTKAAGTAGSGSAGLVDLVVQDEDLEQTGNSNHYDVGNNHQMLNESDMQKSAIAAENAMAMAAASANREANGGFVPLRNAENYKNISGVEATPFQSTSKSDSSDLDVLPEMGEVSSGNSESSSSSGFESSPSPFNAGSDDYNFVQSISSGRDEDPVAEIKDASLMAKAISSILADES